MAERAVWSHLDEARSRGQSLGRHMTFKETRRGYELRVERRWARVTAEEDEMTASIAQRLKAEPVGQKKAIKAGGVEIVDQLAEVRYKAMIYNPTRTVERAKSFLHRPNPDPDTAAALRILDLAWVECQKAAGR